MLYGSMSCSDDPTRVGRPPVVEGFSPVDQALEAFTGDTLVFSVRAVDPERSILQQRFAVDDSVVSGASRWAYVVDDTGLVTVSCTISDGEYDSRIQWVLDRRLRVNHPPEIYSFSPVEPNPTMIIGTELEFAVDIRDPDGDPLTLYFAVDGEQVSTSDRFVYTTDEEGDRVVEAVAFDGELKARKRWNLTVTGIPDTISPAPVPITNLETGAEPGEIDVAWTAVGQDGLEGTASNYLVRTLPTPILTEEDWARASVQPGVPDALPSGQPMGMTISGMIPGRYTHVSVRALDDFGNLSPIEESPGAYTRGMRISGRVLDALTLAPIAGATVQLAHFTTTSGADGSFQFIELPPLQSTLGVRDEDDVGVVGTYYNYRADYTVTHLDYIELFMIPDLEMTSSYYESFYLFLRSMTDIPGNPFGSQQRRWELPVDVYVPEFNANGLDFRQTLVDVLAEFEQILGYPAFHVVDAVPDLGVQVFFEPETTVDNFQFTQWSSDYYPVQARVKFRTFYSPTSVGTFRVIIRHEFGHALGLYHSADRFHLMVGGQASAVSWFSPEELSVIRVRYHIPRGINLLDYSVE
jgi:hypothetical protein